MSRVGRKPIAVPPKVTVKIEKNNVVTVTGPKGTLTQQFSPDMTIAQEDGHIVVTRPTDLRHHKATHGLTRSLLNNMVIGVTTGFTQRMEVHGVGYRAEKRGNNIVLQVGKSHPVEFTPPTKDMSFEVDKDGRGFTVSGMDKCEVGQLAAVIRKSRPPEPYQGKGIRYAGEFVRLKAGKTGKK
ncbi:MAG: 50S ribosomal protein L6 [Caldilineaceae bacterium]